jgi:hypothetical protein
LYSRVRLHIMTRCMIFRDIFYKKEFTFLNWVFLLRNCQILSVFQSIFTLKFGMPCWIFILFSPVHICKRWDYSRGSGPGPLSRCCPEIPQKTGFDPSNKDTLSQPKTLIFCLHCVSLISERILSFFITIIRPTERPSISSDILYCSLLSRLWSSPGCRLILNKPFRFLTVSRPLLIAVGRYVISYL